MGNKAQIVFVDTPGVVDPISVKKYKLENTLIIDPEKSCHEVDLLLVVHDVSNRYIREALNKKLLRLLCLYYCKVPSILVLNKMDTIPKSRRIFDLMRKLTCNRLDGQEGQVKISKKDSKKSLDSYLKRKMRAKEEECVKTEDYDDILEIAKIGNLTEDKTAGLVAGLVLETFLPSQRYTEKELTISKNTF